MAVAKEIMWAAMDFMRTVRRYSEIPDEKVEQMFDVLDPGLKRQILMSALNPHHVVRRVDPYGSASKINAIKEIRAVTGWGLRESKDFIELAESREGAQIPAELSYEAVEKLARNLENTGYKVY